MPNTSRNFSSALAFHQSIPNASRRLFPLDRYRQWQGSVIHDQWTGEPCLLIMKNNLLAVLARI